MISMCMIVGNVEEYIERCLTSFLPIADEVCLVRAIGNQTPDRTLEIAASTIQKSSHPPILKKAIYSNAPTHADWPHVDNFAAARQMSFDLATGDYCFWCDSDDVLESGAEVVRELAARGGYPVFMFPYKIFGRGITVPRERMIQKSAGRWRYPVHECFQFRIEPVQGVEDNRVVVTHFPHTTKTGSNERNLRILRAIPEAEMTAGLWYHLQGELCGIHDVAGAVYATKKAIACPDIGSPERYELFKNLARITKEPNEKSALLHQAYETDPCRREALALLASNALDFGENQRALAYARQMMATLTPENRAWTQRDAVYGWVGNDFYAQALRANGFLAEAEIVRRETLKEAGGPRIALLHATRGRPQKASLARKLWLDLAERPDRIEHIFIFDKDDTASHCLRRFHHLEIPPGGGCVAAWNAGACANESPVLVQMSDDFVPPPRWDELIIQRLGSGGEVSGAKGQVSGEESRIPSDLTPDPSHLAPLPLVLAVSDGHRPDKLICLAIVTRAYLMQDCFLFHPRFKSMYSDNWFTEVAYARGQVIEARDLVFTHNHPVFGTAALDKTYEQQNSLARYDEGEEVIRQLRQGNDWSSVPGFFDYWSFYQFIANQLRDGDTVAEIGVWLGRSIIFLAQELKRQQKWNVKLYAVDHFRGESNQKEHEATVRLAGGNLRAAFEENIKRCGVASMIEILDGDSAESAAKIADGSLAFCFIDAAHDYESVKRDIAAWLPKVRGAKGQVSGGKPDTSHLTPGTSHGILAGHDAQWPEVKRAVTELCPAAKFMGSVWVWSGP